MLLDNGLCTLDSVAALLLHRNIISCIVMLPSLFTYILIVPDLSCVEFGTLQYLWMRQDMAGGVPWLFP